MSLTTEEIWETFHTPLQGFIRKRVFDDATTEDLLQDVFLKIHQHIDTLKDVKKLESWIYQITRNAIIDHYRRMKPTISLDEPEVLYLPEELPDDDVVTDLFPFVQAMIRMLPEQDRQALVLTEYQGLTQKEFAERVGISLSGAKSRVQRAREKLKQLLLECCHFELDRRRGVIDYQPRCQCCTTDACCTTLTINLTINVVQSPQHEQTCVLFETPASLQTEAEERSALLEYPDEKEISYEFYTKQ
jgi:RNA polymerase sigma-70 factor, ECF subfamily